MSTSSTAPLTTTDASADEPSSYDAALAELDRLVQTMESAQLPLDQLLDAYRRGTVLLAYCRARLDTVEAQVKVLEDGQLTPWNESATS